MSCHPSRGEAINTSDLVQARAGYRIEAVIDRGWTPTTCGGCYLWVLGCVCIAHQAHALNMIISRYVSHPNN